MRMPNGFVLPGRIRTVRLEIAEDINKSQIVVGFFHDASVEVANL